MRDRYSLTFAWLSALACAGTEPIHVEPGKGEPVDVIACFCPERDTCGSFAQAGQCTPYIGHTVQCWKEPCSCECEKSFSTADAGRSE